MQQMTPSTESASTTAMESGGSSSTVSGKTTNTNSSLSRSENLEPRGLFLEAAEESTLKDVLENEPEDPDEYYTATANSLKDAIELLREHPSGMITLEDEYTVDSFYRKFCKNIDKIPHCHIRLVAGEVRIFELPTGVHESVANNILIQLSRQNRFIESQGSGDIVIDNNTLLQPDQSILLYRTNTRPPVAATDLRGNMLPKVVIETSYSEQYGSIFSLPHLYFSVGNGAGIQGVILLIIRRSKAYPDNWQMVALYYPYGNNDDHGNPAPTQAISFGDYLHTRTRNIILEQGHVPQGLLCGVGVNNDPPCNQEGLALYQFGVPRDALWHGCDEELRNLLEYPANDLSVDLYSLQYIMKLRVVG